MLAVAAGGSRRAAKRAKTVLLDDSTRPLNLAVLACEELRRPVLRPRFSFPLLLLRKILSLQLPCPQCPLPLRRCFGYLALDFLFPLSLRPHIVHTSLQTSRLEAWFRCSQRYVRARHVAPVASSCGDRAQSPDTDTEEEWRV